jgi:uncharacterized membrane protein SirB2
MSFYKRFILKSKNFLQQMNHFYHRLHSKSDCLILFYNYMKPSLIHFEVTKQSAYFLSAYILFLLLYLQVCFTPCTQIKV